MIAVCPLQVPTADVVSPTQGYRVIISNLHTIVTQEDIVVSERLSASNQRSLSLGEVIGGSQMVVMVLIVLPRALSCWLVIICIAKCVCFNDDARTGRLPKHLVATLASVIPRSVSIADVQDLCACFRRSCSAPLAV